MNSTDNPFSIRRSGSISKLGCRMVNEVNSIIPLELKVGKIVNK
jgi:hypothetical protein